MPGTTRFGRPNARAAVVRAGARVRFAPDTGVVTTEGPWPGHTGHGRGTVGTPAQASPRGPVSAAPRARLLDRLDPRGVVVRALPGYGRTTLAAGWADRERAHGRPVAWPTPPSPGAGTGAWPAVRDALAAALREAGADVPADASPAVLAAVVDAAVDASGAPVALVLDDADDPGPDALAVAALLTASSALRVLVVTGTGPRPLSGAAVQPVVAAVDRLPGAVTLTARDLALTPTELRDAAAGWGHPVDDDTVARLHDLTGGWAGLARAVLDDTRPQDAGPATAAGYAYARDTALPVLRAAGLLDVAALVATAADPTGDTVRLLLEDTGHAPATGDVDVLLALEALGVVRRVTPEESASRWHVPGLLREVLRRDLEDRSPALATDLHRRLARRALDAVPPDLRVAVEHAARARDWPLLETCWIDFGTYLVAMGGPDVDAVYSAIPQEVAQTSTVLELARAAARRAHDAQDDAPTLVLRLMTELGSLALAGEWRSLTPAGRWTGAAAALVAARARGDMPRAMAVMRETEIAAARAGVHGGTSSRSYWWFLVQGGRTALLDGDIGSALDLPMRAYELADPLHAPDVRAAAAGHVALVHALDGLLVDAERWLVRHVEALQPEWEERVPDVAADVAEAMVATDRLDLPAADAALARVGLSLQSPDVSWPFVMRARVRRAVLFGDAEAGLAELEQVERMHHVWLTHAPLVQRIVLRLRAELLLALGELERVSDLLADADPTGLWSDVPRARWLLLTGDPLVALRAAAVGGRRHRVNLADRLDLLVLEAWAAHEAQQPALAVRSFRTARRLAAQHDKLRSFAHLPVPVRDALVAQSGLPFDEDEQARLDATGPAGSDPAHRLPLTPRERTVLSLLDRHGTTQQVADVLAVSVGTVRTQVLRIYAKLGVHDRQAALRRAQELGVLRRP